MRAVNIEVRAPFDGSKIDEVPVSSAEDVENALAKAHALYRNRNGWIPLPARLNILRRAAKIVKERRQQLALQAARKAGNL